MAERLVGRLLVHDGPHGPVGGVIVEVEAYDGPDDPASHAVAGRTRRNGAMWGPPGHAYVYFTYGMHHCLNLVTGPEGHPSAVLIRALAPSVGLELLRRRRGHLPDALLLSGPGRVCAGLGLDRRHDGLDLAQGPLWIGRRRSLAGALARGPRVGIRVGRERPWRLYLAGHPSVSRAPREPLARPARPKREARLAARPVISG